MDLDDQKRIIHYATGLWPTEGESFHNPFRNDKKPGCKWELRSGYIRMVDWADRKYLNMNCYDILKEAKGISDPKKVKAILKDIGIVKPPTRVEAKIEEAKRKFQWATIPFADAHREYLQQWFPDATGDSYFGLEAVSWFEYNDTKKKNVTYHFEPQTICFQLPVFLSGNVKLYMPLEKERMNKWKGNTCKHDIFFEDWPKKSDMAFLSKSWMDGKLTRDLTGLDTYAFQGETVMPSAIKAKKLLGDYKKVFVMYDADEAGYKGSVETVEWLQSIGVNAYLCVWPPKIYDRKEVSDLRELHNASSRDFCLKVLRWSVKNAIKDTSLLKK
jgi:hypothetical protein